MKKAIAISGNARKDFFRRACKFYADKFPDWDLFLFSNDAYNELRVLKKTYGNVKGTKYTRNNTGFHSGAIDVINGALSLCTDYEWVVSQHCDVLMYDVGKVQQTFNDPRMAVASIAASRLSWGNRGLCTESFYVNMQRAQELKFFPVNNTCTPTVVGGPQQDEAERCFLNHVESFGQQELWTLTTRGSYGNFPDLGMLHMHPPQSLVDSTVLDGLGLGEYAVRNFQ